MNVNLALLPKSEQNAIQRDLKAALWANQIKNAKTSERDVMARINALNDLEKQVDMIDRLKKYLNTNALNI